MRKVYNTNLFDILQTIRKDKIRRKPKKGDYYGKTNQTNQKTRRLPLHRNQKRQHRQDKKQ